MFISGRKNMTIFIISYVDDKNISKSCKSFRPTTDERRSRGPNVGTKVGMKMENKSKNKGREVVRLPSIFLTQTADLRCLGV